MTILSRFRSRVTMYSAATAVLLGAFCVLLVADLLLNSEPRLGFTVTIVLAVVSAAAAGTSLMMGDRLGPWPALLLVTANAVTLVLYVTVLQMPLSAVGVIVQVPVLALYLGGFLVPWLARAAQGGVLLVLGLVALWDPYETLDELHGGRNLINVVIFTWMCLEAGIFVQKRFKEETRVDELTGVYNRKGLLDRADVERARAERNGSPICVAVIDLDAFKEVNDTLGHQAGDRVLRELARQWTTLARESDVISRIGGDEFILLLPDTDEEGAGLLLARLNEVAVHPWSWGVVEWDPRDLLSIAVARADERMYLQKAARRSARETSAETGVTTEG